jgi:hypothetical protein
MKTPLLILTLLTSVLTTQINAQDRTTINAMNSEISDNLDLRAVASIFGDSKNLQDFERRLNDPRLQISNLDLNNDDQVDYLRVIESVKKRTHVIILQSVIDLDLYQDVATIEVEKDKYNNVHVQVVGDVYMYGNNYIYEPVYYNTPLIYASFWLSTYRPYYSSWSWNYYPSYYYAWNPFPVFRYRNNIHNCLNSYNQYNYVSYRRSRQAVSLYNSRRSNGYERQHPENSFSRRNCNVTNRYELDQRKNTKNVSSRTEVGYTQNRVNSSRDFSQNRTESPKTNAPQRSETQKNYSQNRTESPRANTPQRTDTQREYSQNRTESPRANTPQRTESQRDYSQNRTESPRVNAPQRTESQRDYSQNRTESPRANSSQRTESSKDNTSSRNSDRRS